MNIVIYSQYTKEISSCSFLVILLLFAHFFDYRVAVLLFRLGRTQATLVLLVVCGQLLLHLHRSVRLFHLFHLLVAFVIFEHVVLDVVAVVVLQELSYEVLWVLLRVLYYLVGGRSHHARRAVEPPLLIYALTETHESSSTLALARARE